MNHNDKTAILRLPEEMRQRAIDLLQLGAIRRIHAQLGYQLQAADQSLASPCLAAGNRQVSYGLYI